MTSTGRLRACAVCVFVLVVGLIAVRAQNPDQLKARLEVGAGFLKSGETDLAVKTFAGILDADPTNWQARTLLALVYTTTNDLEKATVEMRRLKAQNAPEATVAKLEQQITSRQRATKLRDDLTALLQVGKWQEALTAVNASDLPEPRKKLFAAYTATVRGEFEEARQLTSDPQFADFRASVAKRADEWRAARDLALVAFNFLGARYCADSGTPIRCKDQSPLTPAQQTAWNDIVTANGQVSPHEKINFGSAASRRRMHETAKRQVESAFSYLSRFVSLAPLAPEALQASVVMSLSTGSTDIIRAAADRSVSTTGVWSLSVRQCHGRGGGNCTVGDQKMSLKDLPPEGLLVIDVRAKVLRFHSVQPQGWLASMTPTPGPKVFEIPFDKIAVITSKPELGAYNYEGLRYSWAKFDSLLFDFGQGKKISTLLDFTFHLHTSYDDNPNTAILIKTIEDVTQILGQLIPTAKVKFEPNLGGGGFWAGFNKAMTVAGTAAAIQSGDVAQAQMFMNDQAKRDAAVNSQHETLYRQMSDLQAESGRSMADAIFEDQNLKADLDALLTMVVTR